MIGSFLTRALIMALGYAYPAYECFKTVEKNRPEIEMLRFWCQYWILVAAITIFERVGDAFISWLPMYSEAKLAFFIYLWYPKTRGTTYVYDSFLRPYIAKHENDIDRNLIELRSRAGDVVFLYWQKAVTYGQTRFFEILQYVASQSQPPRSNAAQKQPPEKVRQQPPPPVVPPRQPVAQQQQPQAQPPPQQQTPHAPPAKNQAKDVKQEAEMASSQQELPSSAPATSASTPVEAAGPSKTSEAEPMQVEATTATKIPDQNPPATESVIEDAIRMTRARLRKTRTAPAPAASAR